MPPFLIFIRHGETAWNAEGRLQGQRDIPLNDLGRDQARRNGRVLKSYLASIGRDAETFDWVASPLSRARDTMELVREHARLDPARYVCDDRLKEITFGAWEGSTMKELKARDRPSVMARKADKWRFVPPEGESYEMLSARIEIWRDSLERDTVVVAHGGISRVLRGLVFGTPSRLVPVLHVPQDRFLVIRNGIGAWL
ncbi:histidine phosphatase family protein [Breoghania sp. L-A4]|uniref:histidine phosphatase family protein n=1 Tax=Breoghania sp. L-A4 TaxID=2304600 RepID=UPI000E35B3F6|nr:histidine phosphatase family protein [Breoghania sp. L-A4]AXS39577.1 histidine phosphatase family protein [Breoghania sp. L-A4]